MSTEKSTKKISELTEAENISENDVFIVSSPSETTDGGYVSKKMSFQKIFNRITAYIDSIVQFFVKKTQSNNNGSVSICGGTSIENGASIVLTGKDDSTGKGFLYLDANDGVNDARLSLRPNGELYLYNDEDDKKTHIVRSVNNLSADANGNITLSIPEIPNNVESANKWKISRKITLTEDATGLVDIDGSISIKVNDNSHNHVIDNITDLQSNINTLSTDLQSNINTLSTDLQSNINTLSTDLNKKADQNHQHNILDISNLQKFLVPVGTVHAFAGNTSLDGYLLCNGEAISREEYSDLFNVINVIYGDGDGSTTFNLPNLTDRFIQGSCTAGTYKDAGLPSHIHKVDAGGSTYGAGGGGNHPTVQNYQSGGYTTSVVVEDSIYGKSDTVQPPALTLKYYIKY